MRHPVYLGGFQSTSERKTSCANAKNLAADSGLSREAEEIQYGAAPDRPERH
jgi:hypothetical protein